MTALPDLPPTLQTLQTLQTTPDAAGTWIYDGDVHALRHRHGVAPKLFRYQRRLRETASGLVASHVTHDAAAPDAPPIIVESAVMGSDYTLRRFDAVNAQQGFSGSVTVDREGRRLQFILQRGDRTWTAQQHIDAPAVSGPSLHGHILQHWEHLATGAAIDVRMIVLAQRTTYGFRIRQAPHAAPGRRAFTITPVRWWVRLAVAPLRVEFDEATRCVLRYEGRVPPMQRRGGGWRALDARVDYVRHASVYR